MKCSRLINMDSGVRRQGHFRRNLILYFLLLLCSFRVLGESFSDAFDSANKLYEQGKFSEAADAFGKLVQTGKISEPLYFDWGNALFKSGQIGRAIAAYQLAERISPRDPDLRANLQFARNQVQGPTLLPDRIARWIGKLSLSEWTWLATLAFWLLLGLLTLQQWRPAWRLALKPYSIWAGLATLALGACLIVAFYFERMDSRAVVVIPELIGHQAPLEESPTTFTLHDGAELQVLDQKSDWLQVRIDSRRIGWVRKDSTLPL